MAIIQSPAADAAVWRAERKGLAVCGLGAADLLQGQLTAFFASRQCPGADIRAATAWALEQARRAQAVIGGFHSPLEQSALRLFLEAGSPVVVVLARPVASASLQPEWRAALAAGRLAIISRAQSRQRLTQQSAAVRNDLVARLADQIIVAYSSAGGHLARQCARWVADGLNVRRVDGAVVCL